MENTEQFDPNKDTELRVFEDVTAEIEEYVQPSDEEVLAAFVPAALRDGTLLVELIETANDAIKKCLILTLNDQECPIWDKPEDTDNSTGIWCWNVRRGGWYHLKFADIDALQPFPPEEESTIDYSQLGLE